MAYVPGVALLGVLTAGCTGGTGTEGPAADSKPGSPSIAAAPAGKYRTLPEPCRSITRSTLKDLLPGIAELPENQQETAFAGTAAVTYDTDRRVGCQWKSEAAASSRSVALDFERVVSYDTSVSDEDRAREVYGKKETAAHLPSGTFAPGDAEKETASPSDSPSGSAQDTGGAAGAGSEDLRPRTLDDLGDAAFLDDLLTRAGSSAQHRTVSVVFRTSNVIVTVRYTEQPAFASQVPDSKELQEKAQALARKLVDKFSE
ncbi:DUF3558 domain-containing protein [Streptomyces sp. NPDC048411]|uniref:DUF3558 domain-containing protein n=1 Tax=Streptomyces sp. NPDC048411 TaxID=3157206 RepID=UPI003453C2CC